MDQKPITSPSTAAPVSPTVQPNSQPQKKKYKYLRVLLVCLLAEVLIGAGLAAYFWRDSQAIEQQNIDNETINSLQQQIIDLEQTIQEYSAIDSQSDNEASY